MHTIKAKKNSSILLKKVSTFLFYTTVLFSIVSAQNSRTVTGTTQKTSSAKTPAINSSAIPNAPYPQNASSSTTNASQQPSAKIVALEEQARQRGYSEEQIAELRMRYEAQQQAKNPPRPHVSDYTKPVSSQDSLLLFSDSMSLSDLMGQDSLLLTDTTDTLLMIDSLEQDTLPWFGYSLFQNVPDAFKPNAFGPVDPGYLVGPGDVIRLSVWGEVEFQYELEITPEGKVFIPVAGQLYVSGTPFDLLREKVKNILSRHYSSLESNPPKSFLDLSIARISPLRIFAMGEVKAPGGYTMATSSTSFNAFYSIGGPLLTGTMRDIKIIRNKKEIATLDMYEYLTTGKCTTDVRLQNDDVIYVPRRIKTVTVTGSAFRPAIYELKQDEHLLALLGFCGGILPGSNDEALIRRIKPFAERTLNEPDVKVISLNLYNHIADSTEFELCDNDTLEITPLLDFVGNYVTISGAVHYPGIYQLPNDSGSENLSLYKLVFFLGKPIETRAFMGRADLVRMNPDKVSFTTIPLDIGALATDSTAGNIVLQPFDEVIIYEKDVEKPIDLLVTIDGEIRNPGAYTMSTNLTVTDAILRAGGFTREAYKKSVDIYRIKMSKKGTDMLTEVFRVDLPDSIDYSDSSSRIFILEDRDKIVVRPDPDYIVDNYVVLDGLVKYRGKYAIQQRGERLSDIIRRAGGLLPDAFLEGATVKRGRKRLVVNFAEALSGATSKENILLQKDDEIFIPPRPNTVLVGGNVNNAGLFSFVSGNKLRTYIDRAGGFADSTSYILLKSPGGETSKIGKGGFKNPEVFEGSEITVMKKPPRDRTGERQGPSIAEVIRDTLAILASAVTVIGLANKL